MYLTCKNYFDRAEAFVNIGINGFDALGCEITTEYPMDNFQYDCTAQPFLFEVHGLVDLKGRTSHLLHFGEHSEEAQINWQANHPQNRL